LYIRNAPANTTPQRSVFSIYFFMVLSPDPQIKVIM
jgi:hypothetical protein